MASTSMTTVECHKQVRSWRLLRSLIQFLIPTCSCSFLENHHHHHYDHDLDFHSRKIHRAPPIMTSTITMFGHRRRGKVKFCIQPNPQSINPILLLELPLPTTLLAKEMRGGTLRMALETATPPSTTCTTNLLSTPLWTVHCNGKKMGYAVKRTPSSSDLQALSAMRSVVVGAGVVKDNGEEEEEDDDDDDDDDELMYLRAKFRRVRGSSNSESFHLIDPEGSIGQELSIFFFRST